MENQATKLDKAVKISIIIGVILMALTLSYYFYVRPKQEQKVYSDCLNALKTSGKFNDVSVNTAFGKSALDICAKSHGAEVIENEIKQKALAESQKQADEQKRALQDDKIRTQLVSNISIKDFNMAASYNPYGISGNDFTIKGIIQNNNDFPVEKLVVKIEYFDETGKSKIDEHSQEINKVFYAKSEDDFQETFKLSQVDPNRKIKYKYSVVDGKQK